jgi:hypothetical protein
MTTSQPTEVGAQGPPCYRILLELVDGRRVVLDVPGVHAMGGGGIDPVPGRMSIFQPDPAAPRGYRQDRARLFGDIAELAVSGVEVDLDVDVLDT